MTATSVTVTVGTDLSLSLSGPEAGSASIAKGPIVKLANEFNQTLQLSVPSTAKVPLDASGNPFGGLVDNATTPGTILLRGWPVPDPARPVPGWVAPINTPLSILVPLTV